MAGEKQSGTLMVVESHNLLLDTHGNSQVLDLTSLVRDCLAQGGIRCGVVTVFAVGATAGISTTEYEPGLVNRDVRSRTRRFVR